MIDEEYKRRYKELKLNQGINDTGILQTYYDEYGRPIRVPHDCVVDLDTLAPGYRGLLKPIENFLAEVDRRANEEKT